MAAKTGNEFQIGLTMSGAISAGAYTAGVFDFLIQALDEWEIARNGPGAGAIPNHRAGIKVMSGASAGAITAAIGAVALADAKQNPIRFGAQNPVPSGQKNGTNEIKCYLPRLYEIWVEKPGLVAEGNETIDFLQTTDLDGLPDPAADFSRTSQIQCDDEKPLPVVSLLNSRLLDEIARSGIAVTEVVKPPSIDMEADSGGTGPARTQRAYIAETLHIYMTLSNLRGIPYSVPFGEEAEFEKGGKPGKAMRQNCYHMISHGDRVHYAVQGLGSWNSESSKSAFAANDQKRTIQAEWLVTSSSDPKQPNWKDYAICAIASAAFPVGLAPRLIGATLGGKFGPDEYAGRRLPIDSLASGLTLPPAWPPSVRVEDPYWFATADGGIIDNDPFEYARFSLKELAPGSPDNSEEPAALKLKAHLPSSLEETDRAVIMVSPFPELKPIDPEGKPSTDILTIAAALLPALIDQARFKPGEIALAADPAHGSRYLIGPSRVIDGREQRYGIASGLLGGFGGFVARAFRDHDFQLGRRNCQRFLQTTFALPAVNGIIESWPEGVDRHQFRAIQTQDEESRGVPHSHCIIPLFGTAKAEVALPAWPRISPEQFDTLQTRIAARFDAVAPRLLSLNVTGPLRILLGFAVRPRPMGIGLIRDKVLNFVQAIMLADLVRRDMIGGWDLPPGPLDGGDIRLVLAELINPAYDLRSVKGLVKTAVLDQPAVEAALAFCQDKAAAGQNFEVWRAPWASKDGGALYTLMSRKPKWHRWFLWRYFGLACDLVLCRECSSAWLSKPAVDKPGI